jgi:hypothetical protein
VDHPAEETLKRFLSGKAPRQEGKAVVAHLLKGCAGCSRKLKLLIEPEPVAGGAYDAVLGRFDRALIELLESSIDPAHTLRTFLGHAPPPRRHEKGNDEE